MSNLLQVFSSGGGVQSSAIAALIFKGRLPKPDLIAIADTKREKRTTWEYWDAVIVPKMKEIGVETVRLDKEEWAYKHDGLWNKQGTQLMPTFTNMTPTGEPGKMTNFCSTYWKIDTVDNYVRKRYGITRASYCKWIGFSINEVKRAVRMMAGAEFKRGLIWIPLIEPLRLSRHRAYEFVVHEAGWPSPPRSRCFDCPLQSDTEWKEVQASGEFEAACATEDELRAKDPFVFLHRQCKPLREVVFSEQEDLLKGCDSGNCFV